MITIFRILDRFLIVIFFAGANIVSAQMGFHGNLYLSASQSLAIADESFYFFEGVIQSESDTAALVFLGTAQALNASQQSHSQAKTQITAQENFSFPLGQQGRYLPLGLQQGSAAALAVQLRLGPPNFQTLDSPIEQLIPSHYWEIQGDKIAQVQLTWDQDTDLDNALEDLADLLFLGFNGNEWEVIPAHITDNIISNNGPSSFTSGMLVSDNRIDLGLYEALALGSRRRNTALQVSQAITPNGDGLNDVWFIDNIERYPNAKIWVYSRWGKEVFHSAGNYHNQWNATHNNNTKPLPEAPYFYRIDQDNDGTIDLEGWLYITR